MCTQRRRACRLADQGDKNDVLLLRQQPDLGLSGNPAADGPSVCGSAHTVEDSWLLDATSHPRV